MHFSTIVTANWDSRALHVLTHAKKYHPNATFSILFLSEGFVHHLPAWITPYWASDIQLTDLEFYVHTPYELACAVRPRFLELLFKTQEFVWLVDADTLFFKPLPEVPSDYDLYLTPHILYPALLTDNNKDIRILAQHILVGVYNCGIAGYRRTDATISFLQLLNKILYQNCHRSQNGLFYLDQNWYNLAPQETKVYTIKDPSINIGPWNLHERNIADATLVHFSGMHNDTVQGFTSTAALQKLDVYLEYKKLPSSGPSYNQVSYIQRKAAHFAWKEGTLKSPFSSNPPLPYTADFLLLPSTSSRYSLLHKILHPLQAVARYRQAKQANAAVK